jgi:chromate transporter
VTFSEAFRFWLKLGFISFGGPAGQIAIMHRELVQRRRWLSEHRFFHALNYCMLLPGPEAQQFATYTAGSCTKRQEDSIRNTVSSREPRS